jgi:hypothetical protein
VTFEEIAKKAMSLTQAESEAVAKKVIKEYETALKAMNKSLEQVYLKLTDVPKAEYFNYMTKFNRLSLLIDDLQTKYLSTAKIIGKDTMLAAEQAISNSYYRNLYAMNWAEPANGIFTVLPQAVIDVSVYGTPEAWKSITGKT